MELRNKLQQAIFDYCVKLDELWNGQTIEIGFAKWYCFGDILIPYIDLLDIVEYQIPLRVYEEYKESAATDLLNFVKYGN
jgi:hypothetical protein